jgi:uncharacterized membrane protein YeaQ/YmgE (transglycosylase-associated protein family)
MLRRAGIGCLSAIVFYFIGAFGGGFLISVFSANTHDRSTEAAMTGGLVIGPLVAILAGIVGVVVSGNSQQPPTDGLAK